ncbi:unnamed protein product [Amoebophrya sp. A25]|nr:unnamed protein product [Amoebophrya sp. A25]|eukprot:GSA25T00009543001.1
MVYEPVILSVFLFIALLTYIFYGRLELRIVKKGEAALLDTAEYDTSLIRRAMETFDLLTSEFDSTLARADKQAKVPVKQKWQPYIAQQREKYTGICQSLEETLAAHSASETDPRLGKLKTTLQNYMDAQEQQIEVRSTTSMSPEDSSSSKSSKSSDAKVVLEHAQRCADLEVNIALLLRALVGQDDREKAWLQPVL